MSASDSGLSDINAFHYLGDSYQYHAEKLNIRSSSQTSDLSPNASFSGPPITMSTSNVLQGGAESTPFKVPSFPSISSIKPTKSSLEDNDSSLTGIGEASPRLSQFFHPTQESPPQVTSSPQFSEPRRESGKPDPAKDPQPRTASKLPNLPPKEKIPKRLVPSPPPPPRQEEPEEDEDDSFAAVPEHLLRKRAQEERAHQIFENLRNIKIDKKGQSDSLIDEFFGGPSRANRTVSEGGLSDEDISSKDSRKRASTAPVKEVKGSTSTVIPDSFASNHSVSNSSKDTTGTVIKETPLASTPGSRPPTSHAQSSQLPWTSNHDVDLVTPLRKTVKDIPSSIQTPHPPQALDTPTAKPPVQHDSHESVPETSPVKEDATDTEGYRTARESFPREEAIDSSPPIVHGRARVGGVVVSSNPSDGTQARKRERIPRIRDDLSEEEDESPKTVKKPTKSPAKRRRVGKSTEPEVVSPIPPVSGPEESEGHLHRVFARFKDAKMNYYPATVLEPPAVVSSDQEASLDTEVLIRFDDNTEAPVPLRHIRRLSLKEGDTVKLAVEGSKRFNYIIRRFESDPKEEGKADIYGNNIVVVTKKSSSDEIRTGMDTIFLTGLLFAQLNDRRYLFTNESGLSKYLTPASRQVSSSPNVTRTGRPHSRLFQNMVFAVSLDSSREEERTTFVQSILSNSGRVLVDGLHQMFQPPQDVEGDLVLESEWSQMTFCAVIASEYSRKVKYLQALALGVPCLSVRWVDICIKQVYLNSSKVMLATYC